MSMGLTEASVELAKALKQLVNAGLPVIEDYPGGRVDVTLDLEHPFWVAARNARATLAVYQDVTGINGEQEARL